MSRSVDRRLCNINPDQFKYGIIVHLFRVRSLDTKMRTFYVLDWTGSEDVGQGKDVVSRFPVMPVTILSCT